MPRFFTDEINGDIAVFKEDASHISKTLRMQPGDEITGMDGSGGVFVCSITALEKGHVFARIERQVEALGEPGVDITVYQGMCRTHRFEYVVQKCTELGVGAIVPLLLDRCETREYSPAKLIRFYKIAREAAKQSGRNLIPEIRPAVGLDGIAEHELLLCPYELEREQRLKPIISGCAAKDIGIVVGPEGGLEQAEADALMARGGRVFSLGSRILRTETAAPALTAMLMYEADEI